MRFSLTCKCMCIAQVDSNLTSFVTALSEVSSMTDPTYGPDSGGVEESEISSLTDPTYGTGSREEETDAGVGESAIVVGVGVDGGSESGRSSGALSSPYAANLPTRGSAHGDDDSSSWTLTWNHEGKADIAGALSSPAMGEAAAVGVGEGGGGDGCSCAGFARQWTSSLTGESHI